MNPAPFVVGRLPFLISMPYFHLDAERKRFRYLEGTPAELNVALAEGRIQLAPSSSFEALRHGSLYSLLPDICTSGFDSVGSALLFSALFLREPLSMTGIIGAVMIIGAAMISELQTAQ